MLVTCGLRLLGREAESRRRWPAHQLSAHPSKFKHLPTLHYLVEWVVIPGEKYTSCPLVALNILEIHGGYSYVTRTGGHKQNTCQDRSADHCWQGFPGLFLWMDGWMKWPKTPYEGTQKRRRISWAAQSVHTLAENIRDQVTTFRVELMQASSDVCVCVCGAFVWVGMCILVKQLLSFTQNTVLVCSSLIPDQCFSGRVCGNSQKMTLNAERRWLKAAKVGQSKSKMARQERSTNDTRCLPNNRS